MRAMTNEATPGLALVIGGTGGIGAALAQGLRARGHDVLAVGRRTEPAVDYDREHTVADLAAQVAEHLHERFRDQIPGVADRRDRVRTGGAAAVDKGSVRCVGETPLP